jgi:glycerol-3-phosphate dehydrogenase (NAD(P)+)
MNADRHRSSTRVAVIGAGAWGTLLAALFTRSGASTTLLVRGESEAEGLRRAGENARFLPGFALPEALAVSSDAARVLPAATLIVLATPAQRLRANLADVGMRFPTSAALLCASKGIELESGLRMSEVLREALPGHAGPLLALSGPNLSAEIARGLPAATLIAYERGSRTAARATQALLASDRLRVYLSDDLIGVELGGALKNVIAIACGICDGLGYGHNARAGLITRGLAEMTRLATIAGGRERTLAGLAGLGDLVATVASAGSRNYSLGVALGRGESVTEVRARSIHVAEGEATARAALVLAKRLGVELPVTERLAAVLDGRCTAAEGAAALMRRALSDE